MKTIWNTIKTGAIGLLTLIVMVAIGMFAAEMGKDTTPNTLVTDAMRRLDVERRVAAATGGNRDGENAAMFNLRLAVEIDNTCTMTRMYQTLSGLAIVIAGGLILYAMASVAFSNSTSEEEK